MGGLPGPYHTNPCFSLGQYINGGLMVRSLGCNAKVPRLESRTTKNRNLPLTLRHLYIIKEQAFGGGSSLFLSRIMSRIMSRTFWGRSLFVSQGGGAYSCHNAVIGQSSRCPNMPKHANHHQMSIASP
jgi:hypothetical protein